MRCSEARQRLIKSKGLAPDDAEGRRLLRHLRDCPACAAFARTEQALVRDLSTAAVDDIADDISLSTLKPVSNRACGSATAIRQRRAP